jgi:hypothetical protein
MGILGLGIDAIQITSNFSYYISLYFSVGPTMPPMPFHKTKSAPVTTANAVNFQQFRPPPNSHHQKGMMPPQLRPLKRPPAATLPCVDALDRHELMLLRMSGERVDQGQIFS